MNGRMSNRQLAASTGFDTDQKMRSAICNYDERERAKAQRAGRPHNIYGLPLMCEALTETQAAVKAGADLRAAILERFNGRLCDTLLRAVGLPIQTDDELRR